MAERFRAQHPAVFAPVALLPLLPTPSATGFSSSASHQSGSAAAAADWWFKYCVLLRRTLWAYLRNPGNVLLRFIVFQLLGVLSGLGMRGVASQRGLLQAQKILGTFVRERESLISISKL